MPAFEDEPGLTAQPDLIRELDDAEDVMMGRAIPEWWVLLPGAPWGGQTAVLGPYGSEDDAFAQVIRTRGYAMEAKLLRTVPEPGTGEAGDGK